MNRRNALRVAVLLCVVMVATAASAASVVVIAPSVSTSQEARRVLAKMGLSESSSYRRADGILVVVRSGLFDPLRFSYDCVSELKRDAEGQLNIMGEKFHVYLYSIDDELRAIQLKHVSYDARD